MSVLEPGFSFVVASGDQTVGDPQLCVKYLTELSLQPFSVYLNMKQRQAMGPSDLGLNSQCCPFPSDLEYSMFLLLEERRYRKQASPPSHANTALSLCWHLSRHWTLKPQLCFCIFLIYTDDERMQLLMPIIYA